MTPTQLSLKHLRTTWPLVEVVEHWNPVVRRRNDLFGFIDILAVGPDGVLAVQATSRSNVAARIRKIEEHRNIGAVRDAGIRIEVHGWDQPGGPHTRWRLRDVDVSLSDGGSPEV